MTAKEILLKVKALFDAPPVIPQAPVVPPVAPAAAAVPPAGVPTTFTLKDGTEITIVLDDPMMSMLPDTGDLVTIAGAPAPAGDYELQDGTTFTVDATGVITVATPAGPVTQPEFVAPPVPTVEERLANIEAAISKITIPTGLATEVQLQAAEQKITKQDEVINDLFELVEKLVEAPSADPVTLNGRQKERFEKMNARDKMHSIIAEQLKKNKALA